MYYVYTPVQSVNYCDGLGRCFRFVCIYACAAVFLCCYRLFRWIKIYIIGSIMWPSDSCHFQWLWMTLKVTRLLQDLSHAIRRTSVRHFARFQLTRRVARSLGAIAELPVKTYCNSDPWITETEELAEWWTLLYDFSYQATAHAPVAWLAWVLGDQNIYRLTLSTEDINNIIAIRPQHSTVNT